MSLREKYAVQYFPKYSAMKLFFISSGQCQFLHQYTCSLTKYYLSQIIWYYFCWQALLVGGCSLPLPGSPLWAGKHGRLTPFGWSAPFFLPDIIWRLSLGSNAWHISRLTLEAGPCRHFPPAVNIGITYFAENIMMGPCFHSLFGHYQNFCTIFPSTSCRQDKL